MLLLCLEVRLRWIIFCFDSSPSQIPTSYKISQPQEQPKDLIRHGVLTLQLGYQTHPRKSTLNLKRWRFGRWLSFSIGWLFRFHVNFQGCTRYPLTSSSPHWFFGILALKPSIEAHRFAVHLFSDVHWMLSWETQTPFLRFLPNQWAEHSGDMLKLCDPVWSKISRAHISN